MMRWSPIQVGLIAIAVAIGAFMVVTTIIGLVL
jgi:hypothetical protein